MRVVQFGEGNFLRTFADLYFDTLNKEGEDYRVNVIKPRKGGSLESFIRQDCKYHAVLRGTADGKVAESVYKVDVIESILAPSESPDAYYALARQDGLKIIISNTTEAGICFCADDRHGDLQTSTFPAKLTCFLYERYRSGGDGVYILPTELIDKNADRLFECVEEYIKLWGLPDGFKEWNGRECFYCNTLVDRIVSGYPKDAETEAHLAGLIGEKDELLSVGEPFGLWVIENKGDISKYIKTGIHNVEVILTDDIGYYKKRKVRVLNGSHTGIVYAGLWHGKNTVYDCMTDGGLSGFLDGMLEKEIIPFVSSDTAATSAFAESVKERFLNPFLNHRLSGIALNCISKWRARDLPSFKDHYAAYGRIPVYLTKGFSYIMAAYSEIKKTADGKYFASLPSGETEICDSAAYLEFFARGGSITDFMKDVSVWGEDLTAYCGFNEAVNENVSVLKAGGTLL